MTGQTWVPQNSVLGYSTGQPNNAVWGVIVPPPQGGFATGPARAWVHPYQAGWTFGQPFVIQ